MEYMYFNIIVNANKISDLCVKTTLLLQHTVVTFFWEGGGGYMLNIDQFVCVQNILQGTQIRPPIILDFEWKGNT